MSNLAMLQLREVCHKARSKVKSLKLRLKRWQITGSVVPYIVMQEKVCRNPPDVYGLL